MAVGKGMRRRAPRHGLAGLAVVGTVLIAGVVAGWGISPVEPSELSPADVVALRFPDDWADETTGSTPAAPNAGYALASASESQPIDAAILFSPRPTFALPASATAWAWARAGAGEDPANFPVQELRTQSAAAAPTAAAKPDTRIAAAAAQPVAPAPERHPAPHVRKDSSTLFNDAQLASIKSRLKLSAYQEQYWPPVESALRDIGWRATHEARGNPHGTARLAQIDPDGPEVQRLKSAAFPLIMSMNDDQKREVRTLAQVMGLERVAASF